MCPDLQVDEVIVTLIFSDTDGRLEAGTPRVVETDIFGTDTDCYGSVICEVKLSVWEASKAYHLILDGSLEDQMVVLTTRLCG